MDLAGLLEGAANQLVAALIAACFIVGLTARSSRFAANASTSMASLGVLGTFIGIYGGLQNFDVADIEASVPPLLAGLKTAFATSLMGMGAAIVFSIVRSALPARGQAVGNATPDAMLAALVSIKDAAARIEQCLLSEAEENRKRNVSWQKFAKTAFDSAREANRRMLATLGEFRAQVRDDQNGLRSELSDFSRKILEQNHRAVVEALEQVVKEFNRNLTEQFGDNFKQLNIAVGALVTWQNNYREHVELIESRLSEAVSASEKSRDALSDIVTEITKLPAAVGSLAEAGRNVNQRVSDLNETLAAFAAMREKATNTFPQIEKNLRELTDDFSASVKSSMRENAAAISGQREALSEQAAKLNELFREFDQQMQSELNRALQTMARQLASLSQTFVDDYNRFSEQYRRMNPVNGLHQ